jgi:hypothetical protein
MQPFQGWWRQCTRTRSTSTHCWRQRHSVTASATYAMTLVPAWMPWRRNMDLLVPAGTSTRLDWIQCGFKNTLETEKYRVKDANLNGKHQFVTTGVINEVTSLPAREGTSRVLQLHYKHEWLETVLLTVTSSVWYYSQLMHGSNPVTELRGWGTDPCRSIVFSPGRNFQI